jgi:hypothetical protein
MVLTWDDDALEYGYVLARPSEDCWWHMHFGRCWASYPCELLGRPTDILACLQWFATGVVAKSPRFLLTLDGEGVEVPAGVPPMDFTWAGAGASEAAHFQQLVMPLLYDSPAFQSAAAEVVRSQRHLRVVTPGWLVDPAQECKLIPNDFLL